MVVTMLTCSKILLSVDVIGVCKSFGDCQSLTARSSGKEFKKRELTLVDQSAREVSEFLHAWI